MATGHSTYVILSITPPSPLRAFVQDFLVSHQQLPLGWGRGARRGKMGNSLILMKSNVCLLGWLDFGYTLNCEKTRWIWWRVTCNQLKSVLCVCFVSGAEYDNLPTVPLFEVGSALEKVTVNALLVISSLVTWLWNLHRKRLSEDAVNRFRF